VRTGNKLSVYVPLFEAWFQRAWVRGQLKLSSSSTRWRSSRSGCRLSSTRWRTHLRRRAIVTQGMPSTRSFGRRVSPLSTVEFRSLPSAKQRIRVRLRVLRVFPRLDRARGGNFGAGANFTAYQEIKKLAHKMQPELQELPSYQHMVIGLISGAMGPFSNAPIDTIKTRAFSPKSLPSPDSPVLYRVAESDRRTREICIPAHCGDSRGHVAYRRCKLVLQGYYSSRSACRARAGDRVCGVRAREWSDGTVWNSGDG